MFDCSTKSLDQLYISFYIIDPYSFLLFCVYIPYFIIKQILLAYQSTEISSALLLKKIARRGIYIVWHKTQETQ